ncbi:F0F1 ATP synthase subunit delta [Microvirga sp. W0021]|uniref:ATP synthase subunit delta n=1 Tax=Hohaiivirga grylli TaxID=3133970 RepID=A0ABV0BKT6_9HYPH
MAQHGSDTGSIIATVAGRYALALFQLAQETKSVDKIEAELNRFDGFMQESEDLRRLVRSPVFTAEQQEKAIGAILDKAKMKGDAANFIRLVARKGRLFTLPDVFKIYRDLVMTSKGIVRAEVAMAEEPSAKTLASIKAALKETAKADVEVDLKIDPNLIGGLIVKMGSRMVDASVRTKLNSIRLAMKEVR